MDQAIRRSLPWNNIFTKGHRKDAGFPLIFWTIRARLSGRCWVVKWRLLPCALRACLKNLRLLLVCTPSHMGCYDISIVTRYFKSWICICMLSCKIGDSGSSILCYFQMKRGNCIGTRRILVFERRIYYSEAFCVQRCFDWFLQFFWRWSFRARTGCDSRVQWAVLCKRASGSYGMLDGHPMASRHYSLNPSHVVTLDRKTNANNPWKTRNLTDRASSLGRKIALSAPASAPSRFGGHRRRSTGWSAASASSNSSPSSLPMQVICVFPTRDEPH